MFTWKTLIGKNHGTPQALNYHYMRKVQSEPWRQRPRALYLRQLVVTTKYHSVSHTHSLYRSLYNSYNNMTTTYLSDCPKSYLYLYELRAIYKYSLNRLTQNIFTNLSSLPVLTGSIRFDFWISSGSHRAYPIWFSYLFRFSPGPLYS